MQPEKIRFAGIIDLYVTPDDARAMTDALRAAFPQLRIVAQEYWQSYLDLATYHARERASARMQARGEPRLFNPIGVVDPSSRGLAYYESFGDLDQEDFGAWIEHPNWRPVWRWRGDRYLIANLPDAYLIFRRGKFLYRGLRDPDHWRADSRPILNLEATHKAYLHPGTFTGAWSRDSVEGRRFVARAIRVIKSRTTDQFVWVDTDKHRPYANSAITGGSAYRVAADAARWALRGRYNYLGDWNAGMALKPDNYPYSPEEFAPHPKCMFAPKTRPHPPTRKSAKRKATRPPDRPREKRRLA